MIDPVINLVGTTFVGLLLAVSGIRKLVDRNRLAQVVTEYQLIPRGLVWPACWAVIGAEIVLGSALILRSGEVAAALGAALLLALYVAAMGINILRGRAQIDCGCSLGAVSNLRPALILRNCLLTGVALGTLVPVRPRSLTGFDVFQMSGAVIGLGLFYMTAEALLSNSNFARRSSHG